MNEKSGHRLLFVVENQINMLYLLQYYKRGKYYGSKQKPPPYTADYAI